MVHSDPLAAAKRLLGSDSAAALTAARMAHATKATPETVLLLATAARRTGDIALALELLEPLARTMPEAWGVQFELGVARAAMGDQLGAMEPLERAAKLNPKATRPRHALRDLRMITGGTDAVTTIAALDDPSLLAAVAALLDGASGARAMLLGNFGLDIDDIAAACLIAEVGLTLGRGTAVTSLLAKALSLAPGYRPARFRLAEAYYRTEQDEEALAAIAPLCDVEPPAVVKALRGAILMRLGREDDALHDFAGVVDAQPDHALSWLAYGHGLRAVGKRDDAIAAYRRALAIQETLAEAWWSIADLKTATLDTDDFAAMEKLAAVQNLALPARSHVEFALGKAYEDAGDFALAFAHYSEANALRRSIEPYDAAAHDDFVRRMITTMDEAFFAAHAGMGHPGPAPIFIIGMPRSGSTLVEQILASHSMVEGLSELPAITNLARGIAGYPEGLAALSPEKLSELGADYIGHVRARQKTGARYVVDKFPGNAFHIGLIHLILPNARIIDVRRDSRDCCVSLFAQSFAAGQAYSYDLMDLGRQYSRYEALMRHIDSVLPGRVLRVSYEALVDDLEGETRRLLDHCGLEFEPATLRYFDRRDAVRTASSEQVRQPIYRSSIGRWRRFEPWLGPLHEGLARRDFNNLITSR